MTRHGVIDRLTKEVVYKTKTGSYRDTHARAEKKANAERFAVVELNLEGSIKRY